MTNVTEATSGSRELRECRCDVSVIECFKFRLLFIRQTTEEAASIYTR